jgi:type II restriction/modification system DNA methylase subunit YeeA
MNAAEFVRKWAASKLGERAAAQSHFIDLCSVLDEDPPTSDPSGEIYAFEKGARTTDGDGFADVWLKGHFAWEYKGKHKDLVAAYRQVQRYREALDNPPLLVVCDLDRFEVHTNWTNTETWIYSFRGADIVTDDSVQVTTIAGTEAKDAPDLTALRLLKLLFENPAALMPRRTREEITQDAARMFGEISDDLRHWDVDDMRIARFITKTMFCMFATDVGLLPKGTFSEVIRVHRESGDVKAFREYLSRLFKVMNRGGKFAMHLIPEFDGQLFRDSDVPEQIDGNAIHVLGRLDDLNWADVEPSVFGTLFERILDPAQRKMLGAHYTSRADIELIVEPVLMEPLRREWRELQSGITAYLDAAKRKRIKPENQQAEVRTRLMAFHKRIASLRVLDPACGSGNFLYVALALLKALEKELVVFADVHGITLKPRVHPLQLHGIETSEYAHELSSIVIWIGYLQWKHRNAIRFEDEIPILQPLEQVELKDAIVDLSKPAKPREATWPAADVIVGNPPFLGGKRLRTALGDDYVEKLFAVYDGRVARESDLCCYWFEKAREAIETGGAKRAGLLATQAVRGGANRKVLERIKDTGDIFYAQADRPWIQDGVAVRVSMVGFDDGSEHQRLLNEETEGEAKNALLRARPVASINANLTFEADVTKARRLKENVGVSFMGDTKVGPFDILPREAKAMLEAQNPHGRPNSDVVRPWVNGLDVTRRPRGMWIIDFPPGMSEQDAAKYEAPFEFIKKHVKPERVKNARKVYAERWWIHGEPRPDMRAALAGLNRYLATPNLTKHRLFVWFTPDVLPDHQLIVFARSDDYFFGVLHSHAHEVWALLQGTQLESRPRYTPTTCFETFPFPHGTQDQHWAISIAAKDLDDQRNRWLNPEGMVGAKELGTRTLTNLYNQRPTWLANAHRTLDEAVFAAYAWREPPDNLTAAEIVARLLNLNLQRDPA